MKGKLRWWIIGLVTLGTILNYLARATLSVAAPTLKAEFSMTTADYSWVVLAFQASYTVMQTVAGGVVGAPQRQERRRRADLDHDEGDDEHHGPGLAGRERPHGLGLGALVAAIIEAPSNGWTDPLILAGFATADDSSYFFTPCAFGAFSCA